MEEIVRLQWFWLALAGLGMGIVGSALGVGGGVLLVPALVLGLGFAQKSAQGISLAVMVPMALMAAARYWWNPDVKMSPYVILVMVPCAIVGAIIGRSIAAAVSAVALRRAFGILIIATGLKMVVAR